ncbi:WD40-repeat-containing domain protein, partial [Dunaliella salina]
MMQERDSGATINTADSWRTAAVLRGHAHWVSSLAFTPDGHYLVSSSHDNTIRVWDLLARPFRNRSMNDRHNNRVNCVAISPDGKTIISGSSDRTVRSWSLDDGQCIRKAAQRASVTCVAFSPGGHEVACGAADHV